MAQDGEGRQPGGGDGSGEAGRAGAGRGTAGRGTAGRSGFEHPTSEFPAYAKGQATPEPAQARRGDDEPDGDYSADSDLADAERRAAAGMMADRRGRGLIVLGGLVVLAILLALGARAVDIWPSWRNPFAQEETDRSGTPLLKSIQDLSRYVAAEGNFQVVIDLQKDRRYVPDFLVNERTLFVGAGRVEAYVDFSKIAEGAVVESADRRSVEITLPAPQLGDTNLDLSASYVFAEERGLFNRIGDVFGNDPNRQREVYRLAEERISAAARDSGLAARAQENTQKMLEGLLRSLGYEIVKITYATP